MIKTLVIVAALGPMASIVAIAQGKQGEEFGSDVASLLEKLEAQCAHRRRTMPPDPRDDCNDKLHKLRSEAQVGTGQGGLAATTGQPSDRGQGIGPGNGAGQGNSIGPGSGGGQGKGRR
jgi:hypothetical protein